MDLETLRERASGARPAMPVPKGGRRGFTLIEIMMVIIILSVLYMASRPVIGDTARKTKESVLRGNLRAAREVISRFYRDNDRYPRDLGELVEKRYLVKPLFDPVTESTGTWVIIPSGPGVRDVFDVRSGAAGKTIEGEPYSGL